MNPLQELEHFGQAPWLDFVSRDLVESGELKRLATEDGIKGLTSNPSIFEQAIAHSDAYDGQLESLLKGGTTDAASLFRHLSVTDIQNAADALLDVYQDTLGGDGFVSLEVSPYLADDEAGTVAEARALWAEVDRPNLMIKVPATEAGIAAFETLTSEGINVNVTLLFAKDVYIQIAEAYLAGLEAQGPDADLSRMASVASFFISRIDATVDAALDEKISISKDEAEKAALAELKGKIAIANAKAAYDAFARIFSGERWEKLAARGARPQRLLWASTGTKNPDYSDCLYVDSLIGADTVNTMPPATMAAFKDHGNPANTLEAGTEEAQAALEALSNAEISLDDITEDLLADGIRKFTAAADRIYGALITKANTMTDNALNMTINAGEMTAAFDAAMAAWTEDGTIRRLHAKDASVWSDATEAHWLGWLDIPTRVEEMLPKLEAFATAVKEGGFSDVVLLGMGGSSLGAEVVFETIGRQDGFPNFHILDSTDPDQISTLDTQIDLANTLFIVASKSGSTLEPNIFKAYYFDKVSKLVGADKAGEHFVAITDPGSKMEQVAARDGFTETFLGDPEIGGRYSVLSPFGMVPSAAAGMDLKKILANAQQMQAACGPDSAPATNPGVQLGLALGVAATQFARDKLTVFATPGLKSFGAWLEQLVAESTGKEGKSIIPIDGEPLGRPTKYGNDRIFVSLKKSGESDNDELIATLAEKHPVITIEIEDPYQLFQLFYQWEIATAVAGAVMGINPFDQPDVEAAKIKTRELMEAGGAGSYEAPIVNEDGILIFADAANAKAIKGKKLVDVLAKHLDRITEGDYVALLAFFERNEKNAAELDAIRGMIRDKVKAAGALGFGPRFLHSTGQAYKGGANTGVFIQLTANHATAHNVPGEDYGFGAVVDAQAAGDLAVLNERGRRVIRVHLTDIPTGLKTLKAAVKDALGKAAPAKKTTRRKK